MSASLDDLYYDSFGAPPSDRSDQLYQLAHVDARAYSVDVSGSIAADVTAANDTNFAAARAAALAAKLPLYIAGPISISQPLTISSGETWIGNAKGDANTSGVVGSRIIWSGAAGATMLTVTHPLRGTHLRDLEFDGRNLAANCIVVRGGSFGWYQNIRLSRFTTGAGLTVTATTANSAWNTFINFVINGTGNGLAGLYLDGDSAGAYSGADACLNTFQQFHITHSGTRPGILLADCDNDTFIDIYIFRSSGSAAGVQVAPTVNTNGSTRPRGLVFLHLFPGSGGWVQPDTTVTCPATIFGLQIDSGAPAPVLNGTPLFYTDEDGAMLYEALTLTGSLVAKDVNVQLKATTDLKGFNIRESNYGNGTFRSASLLLGDSGANSNQFGISVANAFLLYAQSVSAMLIGTNSNVPIIFGTGATERMRLLLGLSVGTDAAAGLGNILAANDLISATAGKGLKLKAGAGQRAGNAVLAGGTITIANTSVSANTVIVLTRKTIGGTVGTLTYVPDPGVGFTINSTSPIDTSTVSYLLVELTP